jgi:hypothetical protein
VLVSSASGLGTALAGLHWWAVLLVVCIVLTLTDGVMCWLATHSKANRISTFLITWEGEPPSKGFDQDRRYSRSAASQMEF